VQPRKLSSSVLVPPAPVRVPSQRPLPRVSCQSAIDKGDNEIIPGAVHRSHCIYLMDEENHRKSQLGDDCWRLCDQSSPQIGLITSKLSRHDLRARQKWKKKKRMKGRGLKNVNEVKSCHPRSSIHLWSENFFSCVWKGRNLWVGVIMTLLRAHQLEYNSRRPW